MLEEKYWSDLHVDLCTSSADPWWPSFHISCVEDTVGVWQSSEHTCWRCFLQVQGCCHLQWICNSKLLITKLMQKIIVVQHDAQTSIKIFNYKEENASVKTFDIHLPNDFPHLLENFVLHKDEDRCNLIGEHVGVCCCCQPFSSQGGHIKTTRQLVEKTRMSWNRNS